MNTCSHSSPTVESVWESRSQIEGVLGEASPLKSENPIYAQTHILGQIGNNLSHPLAFITKRTCISCGETLLRAYESYFHNDKIIFDFVSERKLLDNMGIEESHNRLPIHTYITPVRLGRSGRNPLKIKDYSLEAQSAIEELIQEIFSVEGFLSEAQAKVISKIKLGRKLRSSTERNTKRQLKKKIRKIEYIKDFWEDLEELL